MDLPVVQSVDVVDGEPCAVSIRLTRAITGAAIGSFFLSDPERLVVDLSDAGMGEEPLDLIDSGCFVSKIDAEEIEEPAGTLLRITLYLQRAVEHDLEVEGDTIRIVLAAATPKQDLLSSSSPAESAQGSPGQLLQEQQVSAGRPLSGPELSVDAPSTVSSLDFKSLEDVSRVIIGTNKSIDFTSAHPETNLIVVDLVGALLANSLDRPLDISQFISPVRMVRAYRTRSGTRVAINLRRSTDYEIVRVSDNLIYVDVAVPEDMKDDRLLARQSFSLAAPSGPESSQQEGLRSAYQQELLIGSTGRTVDPQAVFGSGVGSMDPSSMVGMAAGFMYDNSTATGLPYTGQKINVDLVNADIHSVFRLISHVSKLNLVAGDDVSGRITVSLENVPWDQAFAAILQAKGLGSQRFGNIVRIAPIETIKAEQQTALEAKRAADELEELQLLVVPLDFAQADDLSEQVEAVLSGRGTIEVDSRSNQLVIQDTEANLAQVRELIRQLDTSTPQILIEARIVEATSNFSRGLGIQWGGVLDASATTGSATGSYFPNSISAVGGIDREGLGGSVYWQDYEESGTESLIADLGSPVGETSALSLNLGSITGILDLDARLSAMESEGWGKIVSSPHVTTMDNQEASIKQGARIPFLSTSAGGTQVKFVTAALTLTVTPHITTDNTIFLELDVTNDRPDFSQSVQGQPAIQIKQATTALLVEDGDTTVIGGVYATENSFNQDKVPFLSKIPLLGYLFRNSGEVVSRNEMLVFITPRVLSTNANSG